MKESLQEAGPATTGGRKRAGKSLFYTSLALAAAMAVLVSTSGCLKVIGLEDRKERVPFRDAVEDAPDSLDVEAEGGDVPVEPDELEISDVPGESDVVEIDDAPLDPDVPDDAELPPGLVWVSIPEGSFEMGCSMGDRDCDAGEEPRHTVNVSAFRMTETEITQAQYEWVTGSNPSGYAGCPDCPVEQVDWYEAKAFCEAVGGRLPSEAEWEYAARAGTTTRYYCGDDDACLDGIAWYSGNSGGATHRVKEKTANAFGLYDMLGNVWEWVEDCWHANYVGAPSTGEVWSGGDCSGSMLRGASWFLDVWYLRVSARGGNVHDLRSTDGGFRCAQTDFSGF